METKILKVIAQTGTTNVQTKNGQQAKCMIRLKELGGDYADEYQCALWGDDARCNFAAGKQVAVSLRFSTHENNGTYYQDITVNEIVPVN